MPTLSYKLRKRCSSTREAASSSRWGYIQLPAYYSDQNSAFAHNGCWECSYDTQDIQQDSRHGKKNGRHYSSDSKVAVLLISNHEHYCANDDKRRPHCSWIRFKVRGVVLRINCDFGITSISDDVSTRRIYEARRIQCRLLSAHQCFDAKSHKLMSGRTCPVYSWVWRESCDVSSFAPTFLEIRATLGIYRLTRTSSNSLRIHIRFVFWGYLRKPSEDTDQVRSADYDLDSFCGWDQVEAAALLIVISEGTELQFL